jgi:ankyrin repeat protein
MTRNLRGEITPMNQAEIFAHKEEHFLQAIHDSIQNKTYQNTELLKSVILPNIVSHMAKLGYVHFLQELKSYGVNFSSPDYDGRTALHIAARESNLEMVNFLIEEGKILK